MSLEQLDAGPSHETDCQGYRRSYEQENCSQRAFSADKPNTSLTSEQSSGYEMRQLVNLCLIHHGYPAKLPATTAFSSFVHILNS
jgi:hypothetical protein